MDALRGEGKTTCCPPGRKCTDENIWGDIFMPKIQIGRAFPLSVVF